MTTCTFFGHRNAPDHLEEDIYEITEILINKFGVERFYVGNNGNFDQMVYRSLEKLKEKYPFIVYYKVLAYHPGKLMPGENNYYKNSIVADGLEKVPKRFAVSKRNHWMLGQSDYLVSYVVTSYGGAYNTTKSARKKGSLINEVSRRELEVYKLYKKPE